jgi:hypothetical protein
MEWGCYADQRRASLPTTKSAQKTASVLSELASR